MIQHCGDARAVAGFRASEADTSSLICVKEAAHRLGVSKSTIYRFDRVNGPFRFIIEGRRIYVDLNSFDVFRLSRLEAHDKNDSEPAVESRAGSQASTAAELVSEEQCSSDEPNAKESGYAEKAGRCGQRPLVIKPRHSAFIATFSW